MTLEEVNFNLRNSVMEAIHTLEMSAAEKTLDLRMEYEETLSHCYIGDPTKLRQLLLNLIGNAIKFTNEGGIIVRVRPTEEEDRIHFTVEDTGIGIPTDRIDTIFDSFTQADNTITRKYGGTGLGTTISKEIVQLMGGRIWVESEPGMGSRFHFIIRLIAAECKA